MIRDALLVSTVSGFLAALLLTVAHSIWITPLILKAEVFEDAAESASVHSDRLSTSGHHHHEAESWKPADGIQRTLFTFAATVLMAIGYASVLVSVYLFRGAPSLARWGALYGLLGFCVFFFAPSLGLPPKLPGVPVAELMARQQWWVMTAALTAAGLAVLLSQERIQLRLLGVALIGTPHFIAAPHLANTESLVPMTLQNDFRMATTFVNALFWVALGLASATLYRLQGVTDGNAARH